MYFRWWTFVAFSSKSPPKSLLWSWIVTCSFYMFWCHSIVNNVKSTVEEIEWRHQCGWHEWQSINCKTSTVPSEIQPIASHLDTVSALGHREEIYREETDTSITWIFVSRVPRATQNLPASAVAFFFLIRYPWKFCSINYCRITVSDHFYWFPFIKSVNITFYFAKVCFSPYLLLIKIVKSTGWRFQMLIYKKQSSEWYKCHKI
jgi:hypothetical protein